MSECRVQLRRNTTDTAWGFRLQGGQDFSSPLVVQRVFSGSPSDGQLQRGDVLVSINNKDVSRLQQKQAEDFIKTTGTSLSIVVKRSAGGLQLNNVPVQQPQYANEPSQPVHTLQDGGSTQYRSPQPPSSLNASDGYSQPKKYSPQNVWTPSAAASYPAAAPESPQRGGGGFGSYDQQQQTTQKYQPVSFQKPVSPAGYGGAGNQFSTDSPRYETGPPKGGAGSSWRGPSGGSARPEQPSQVPVQHEYSNSNQGHLAPAPRFLDEMPPQSIQPSVIGQQEGDEEDYEPKSVREIKAMFNKPSKPVGQQRSSNKPIKFQPKPAPAVSHQQPSWNAAPAGRQVSYQQSRAFSPPSHPVEQRGSVLSPQQDPYSGRGWPSLSPPPAAQPVTGLLKPKTVGSSIKPGAGYSYQGIVTVTQPKKVHQGSKSQGSGSGSGPAKKKEFDPAQSLVLQMLQEENERAKRGDNGPAEEEYREPPAPAQARGRRPQMQQQQPQIPQQQGGSSRLQELLERDRATTQQEEDQRQPPPSQPQYQQQQQQQYRQPQQQRIPQQQQQQPQQSYQSDGSNARQVPAQNYAPPHQQPSGGYQSYQNEPQYGGGYQQQPATSPGNYYQQGGASPRDYYQSYDDGVPISDF